MQEQQNEVTKDEMVCTTERTDVSGKTQEVNGEQATHCGQRMIAI
jgi:hypothetical protein